MFTRSKKLCSLVWRCKQSCNVNMLNYRMVNLIYINIEQILVLFFSITKFMLLPNVYERLKILGNGIMESFESKFDMFTTCVPKVACSTLFPLRVNIFPLNFFPILIGGPIDFWHPYQCNKHVIAQHSTMDNQKTKIKTLLKQIQP
jgi:hypothetical protein